LYLHKSQNPKIQNPNSENQKSNSTFTTMHAWEMHAWKKMNGNGGAEKALQVCAKAAAQTPSPIGAANPKRGSTPETTEDY
jgi:hypothetical protein